jgi:hypothetical protein
MEIIYWNCRIDSKNSTLLSLSNTLVENLLFAIKAEKRYFLHKITYPCIKVVLILIYGIKLNTGKRNEKESID